VLRNYKYSHAGYCIKHAQEVDKPKAIPAPKTITPTLNKSLPVTGIKTQPLQLEESDADAS
jgi:hypothetical protein